MALLYRGAGGAFNVDEAGLGSRDCADYNDWKAVLPPVSDGENGRLRLIVPARKQRFILVHRAIRLIHLAYIGIDSGGIPFGEALGTPETARQLPADSPRSPRPVRFCFLRL